MPHAQIINRTPFSVTPLFLADKDMRPMVVPLIRATYAIGPQGELSLHDEQLPPAVGGEYWGDPKTSSYKFESECAYVKPATDVVMLGHAHAPHAGATEVQVGVRVGPVQKVLRVLGDRVMSKAWNGWSVSPPQAFEAIPLIYERAFGGWDRSDEDPDKHRFEPRNPVGTGFRVNTGHGDDVVMPNIEDPEHPFERLGDAPAPAGFGFIAPGWAPRTQWAGTYDQQWDQTRKPLLPLDFDLRFFSAASPGLVAPGYLRGDEPVVVVNASSQAPRLAFHLPGVAAPVCECQFMGHQRATIGTVLDTVVLDMDAHLLYLTWRGHRPLRNGPHDLVAMTVSSGSCPVAPSLQAV